MLERLPSELDAEIVKRAGPLTLLLLGRLPMPLERETLVLLWCKCLIANDFDSVRRLPSLPHEYSYLCTIFAQSESMAQKLSGMGYRTALIKQRLANNFQDLVKYIVRLIDICPPAGRLIYSFLRRMFPHWPMDKQQHSLIAIAAIVVGDTGPFNRLVDSADSVERQRILLEIGRPCLDVAYRLGHTRVVRLLLDHQPAQSLDVHNAVIANNIELLEIVATSVTAASFSSGVKTAVRYNYGEIAARSIELWRQHGAQDIDVARLLIREGKVEMLRAMDKPELLRSSGIRDSICYAASHGYLAVIKFVFETTGDVTWLNDALYGAFKGGFVDVAQWLIHGPAKNVSDDILWHAALNGVASTFIMLMQERPGVEPRVLMDAAVAYNNMELLRRMNALGYRCTPNAVLMFTPHCRYYPHPFEFGQ
ncbi:hypothetical protein HK105_206483 [Polyrhizophydium stewartii]|uniref:Ankyrin repeat protein n=1 Tax=Polyrhizophydium stewartii TaxID=2732419 RepID=A0ABR4N3G9_9FUNG